MKNLFLSAAFPLLLAASCGPARSVFHKDTPREAYERALDKADIDETPEGRAWKAAAASALAHPHTISLPYRQAGQFPAGKPRALALRFAAKQGQRVQFQLEGITPQAPLYAELFREENGVTTLVLPANPEQAVAAYDIPATGNYLLRLQPQLGKTGTYSLLVSTGPSLGFPVAGKASAGSFWGADRDAGARRHEGVDIFAAKRTPAVAAADGTISSVAEGGLGGKYVFLRPDGAAYNLYYAHLDEQRVQPGQRVRAGEVIGLVGNTGNARTTAPHLHFGIYGGGRAVDPWPFIDQTVKDPPRIPAKPLPAAVKVKKALRAEGLAANTVLPTLAVTSTGYLAEGPDGAPILLPFAAVRADDGKSS